MRIILFFLIIEFLFQSVSNGQEIDNDKRIIGVQSEIINILIKDHQITYVQNRPILDYLGYVFIKKHMDFYSVCDSNLLICFGSFGSHADLYWGIISTSKSKNNLYVIKKNDNVNSISKFIPNCDSVVLKSILYYTIESDKTGLMYHD